ncbi:MAG: YceI family protein [Candidatus Eremiobacteraeota bacterium]|nr:YceI family protein [Candidatus Eremiobacteraeota bacterium]
MSVSAACNRYVVAPRETKLEFVASSSLHPVKGSATDVHGYVDAVVSESSLSLEPAPSMHLEFPVERLRSGNDMQDREMWKRLDSKRSPSVVADLRELRPTGPGRYRASGDITLAGRTRRYEGELAVIVDGNRLRVDGKLPLDIRHFGISPPRFLMFTVAPVVDVRLHLVAQLQESS